MSPLPTQWAELSPDEAVAMLALQRKLEGLDLERLEKERQERETPREKLLREIESQGAKKRMTQAKKRKPGRPKVHWKTKKRKHREFMRKYMAERYHEVAKPRRKEQARQALVDNDWYSYLMIYWKSNARKKIVLSKDEWDRCVAPRIGEEHRPIVFRYDTAKPVSLYNIVVKDSDTRRVLFDGAEQRLRDIGAACEDG